MEPNNRKRTRVSVHFEIGVLLANETNPITTQIVNISMTGILCKSRPSFQRDAPCRVILSLNDESRIVIDSKILRVGSRETAISFASMDEESFSLLRNIVRYNTVKPDLIEQEFQTDAFGGLPD
ncbi:MAG: PilZ domain-containing protein [Syntrophales bacterium]|nr:PilZ domain-containing protein [Syntrophales bacterium]